MEFNTICVCGAGTMGSGIAQLAITRGFDVILYEPIEIVLERSKTSIGKNLEFLVEKKKISSEEKEKISKRIHLTSDLNKCVADLFIEAIVEDQEAKIDLFNKLSRLNNDNVIFATNTSSLSISEMAAKIPNPARIVGMHFFNPAPIMKLVEIIKTEKTSDEVVQVIIALSTQLEKTPVVCKDSPGFIVNRVARPYYIESLRLVETCGTSFKTIDTLLESTGFKLGPFKLMDLIGNDINYTVSESVYEQLGKPDRLKPSFIQKQRVDRGELGKKSGKGYYEYK